MGPGLKENPKENMAKAFFHERVAVSGCTWPKFLSAKPRESHRGFGHPVAQRTGTNSGGKGRTEKKALEETLFALNLRQGSKIQRSRVPGRQKFSGSSWELAHKFRGGIGQSLPEDPEKRERTSGRISKKRKCQHHLHGKSVGSLCPRRRI